MPKKRFQDIYEDLKEKILFQGFPNDMLPTEYTLIDVYACSRNTVRRAIQELSNDGFVKSVQGKGVVILDPVHIPNVYLAHINDLSKLSSLIISDQHKTATSVIAFEQIMIDQELSERISLPIGKSAYYIERLQYVNQEPLVLDIHYFLDKVVTGMTKHDAQSSIYRFIEEEKKMKIIAARRILTMKLATAHDQEVLALGSDTMVGVIMNYAHLEDGELFEYTESHYCPKHFVFMDIST